MVAWELKIEDPPIYRNRAEDTMSNSQPHRVVPVFAPADTAAQLPIPTRAPSSSQSGSCSTTMEPIHGHSPLSAPPISAEMTSSTTSDTVDPHSMDEDDEIGELWADRIYPALMGKNHRLISTGSLIMDLIDCHGHTAVVSKRIQDNVLEHPQVSPQQRERMGMVIKAQKCVRDLLLDLIKEFGKDKACTEEYNHQVLREASERQMAGEDDGQGQGQGRYMVDVDGDDAMQE